MSDNNSDHTSLLDDALNLLRVATELEENKSEDHRIEAATKVRVQRKQLSDAD